MKYELDMMNRQEKWRAEGVAEGIAKGIVKGKAEGIAEGIAKGERKGLEIATKIFRLFRDGKSEKQIARTVGVDISTVRAMLG